MSISNWNHDKDIALYERDIAILKEQVKGLQEIEEQHRILNGKLREEIQYLRHQITYERSQTNDDGF